MTVTTPDKALGAEDGLTDYKEDDIGMKENREERFERVKDARSR